MSHLPDSDASSPQTDLPLVSSEVRAQVGDLPATPGVYIFHGDGELPLYIGKSVSIRSRVLSHLRNPDEARLLRQTRRISHICTAGEIGALLLEAQMIKTQQPLMNQRLRHNRQLCTFQWRDGALSLLSTQALNFAAESNLHGLYRNRHAALEGLARLADEHRLCLGLLGVEKLSKGRPCFRATVNKCAGACAGRETMEDHHERLKAALEGMRLTCWPHPGAVAIVEEGHGLRDFLVVRNWCYLGKAHSLRKARALDQVAAGFDADGYKILCGPMMSGQAQVVSLGDPKGL